jgi:hypothetical protein
LCNGYPGQLQALDLSTQLLCRTVEVQIMCFLFFSFFLFSCR